MDKIRIDKKGSLWKVTTAVDGGIIIEADRLVIEKFIDNGWSELVSLEDILNEQRKDRIVGKRRLLKLIEDNGGIPNGMSRALVYKVIIDGNEAEKEYEELNGEKFDWEEHERKRKERVEEIKQKLIRGREIARKIKESGRN